MNIRLYISLIAFAVIGCKSNQITVDKDFSLTMDKGACFGSCPVYSIQIDHVGNMIYDGKRFTEKSGMHKNKLSKSEFQSVIDQLGKMNFFALPENYRSGIADLPSITIAHTHKGLSKSVTGKDTRPALLKDLQKLLESFAQKDGWVSIEPIAPDNTDVAEEEEEEEKEIIEREMIIQFKPSTIISRWMRDYREYQMYVKKPLDDDKKTWVVQYNTKLINPQVLLHKVQSDSGVASAEFNTKAEMR